MQQKAEEKLAKIKALESQHDEKKKKEKQKLEKKIQIIENRIESLNIEKEVAQLEMAEKTKQRIETFQKTRHQIKLVTFY